ncbi:MAG: 30S ribosomal protein S6 [Candidatus Aminicenantes bacterium]
MRNYETAFLLAPNLPEEEAEQLIEQMAEIVAKKNGKMKSIDKWGKRRLAYPIEKFSTASYVFFDYDGTSDIPAALEQQFKQKEAFIRYMTILKEKAFSRPRKSGPEHSFSGEEKTGSQSGAKEPEEKPEETQSPEKKGE